MHITRGNACCVNVSFCCEYWSLLQLLETKGTWLEQVAWLQLHCPVFGESVCIPEKVACKTTHMPGTQHIPCKERSLTAVCVVVVVLVVQPCSSMMRVVDL